MNITEIAKTEVARVPGKEIFGHTTTACTGMQQEHFIFLGGQKYRKFLQIKL
jgi:hypothetical protein